MDVAPTGNLAHALTAGWLLAGALACWALGLLTAMGVLRRRHRRALEGQRHDPALLESLRLGLPAGVAVFVLDAQGRIRFSNQGAYVLLGLSERLPLQGRSLTDLPCWDEAVETRQSLARALLKADMGKPQKLRLSFTREENRIELAVELRANLSTAGEPRTLLASFFAASPMIASDPTRAAPRHANAGTAMDAPTGVAGVIDAMLRLLPSARSLDEASRIISAYLARAFPGTSGALYLPKPGVPGLHALRSWGNANGAAPKITDDACWAMRHSELHWVEDPQVDLACEHHPGVKSACLPLLLRAERVGVLSLAWRDQAPDRAQLESLALPLATALSQTLSNLALREQATRDPLTRLLNRSAFDAELPALLMHAQDNSQSAALMVIDIDHFKSFNDRYGHDTGDLVLKNVAMRISQSVRASDRAFRFGGEELVVMMPAAGPDEAQACARRIQGALAELALVNRGERLPPVTVSIGIATYPTDCQTAETLFQTADAGVYAAKAAGRNMIVHQTATARAA